MGEEEGISLLDLTCCPNALDLCVGIYIHTLFIDKGEVGSLWSIRFSLRVAIKDHTSVPNHSLLPEAPGEMEGIVASFCRQATEEENCPSPAHYMLMAAFS